MKVTNQSKAFTTPLTWGLLGVALIALAFAQDDLHWGPVVLALIGGWWLYCGMVGLFPSAYFRRHYPKDLLGKKYVAVVEDEGFEVTGDVCSWRVKWQGVSAKGENPDTLILYAANTIFMFGKKYLTAGELSELKRLAKMSE